MSDAERMLPPHLHGDGDSVLSKARSLLGKIQNAAKEAAKTSALWWFNKSFEPYVKAAEVLRKGASKAAQIAKEKGEAVAVELAQVASDAARFTVGPLFFAFLAYLLIKH